MTTLCKGLWDEDNTQSSGARKFNRLRAFCNFLTLVIILRTAPSKLLVKGSAKLPRPLRRWFFYAVDIIKFANGGDRNDNTTPGPEQEFCNKNDIETLFGIGGDNKSNSSSWILKKWKEK